MRCGTTKSEEQSLRLDRPDIALRERKRREPTTAQARGHVLIVEAIAKHYVDDANVGAAAVERVDVQAFRIDRHRDEPGDGGLERAMCSEVAGLLDGHAVARLEQGGRDPECRLGPGYDQHLISLAADCARGTEVLGDSDARLRRTTLDRGLADASGHGSGCALDIVSLSTLLRRLS